MMNTARYRLRATVVLCACVPVILAILSGCAITPGPAPTPTGAMATVTPATTKATETAAPTAVVADTVTTTPADVLSPTPAPEPSATPSPAEVQKTRLTLRPVQVEAPGVFGQGRTINLPPGFHIRVYAASLPGVRWLGLSPQGLVYATMPGEGKVVTLPDANKDGVADDIKTFADGLPGVHGIDFREGTVYVATESQIIRLQDTNGDGVADKREVLASDLPSGGGHSTRTIAFGPDGKLYVSAGSSCNVCEEEDPKRAAISRYTADGKFEKVYAKGLRNAVGIIFHPLTGELWATNNGRDNLGDNIPPETIYKIREDANYGWPYCYGDRVPDQTMHPPPGYCDNTELPAVKLQAHMAPLGLAFYFGDQFPAEFKGDMFVAFHGSWNRSVPVGYKVMRIRFKDNQPDASAGDLLAEDFATGWLMGGQAWGRPVDPLVAPDGSLLLTDDRAGVVYSIYYRPETGQ